MIYRIDYKLEGSIEIEAENEEEAKELFYQTDEQDIVDNCYLGNQIEDIVVIS